MSVIMVASKSVIAQTIETIKGPVAPDQLRVGGQPEDIAVNTATNKIYMLDPVNGIVTVLDSTSGTVKKIHVGFGERCPYCMGVDSRNNKVYVANTLSDTVSVIDGNSDTVKKNIQVGRNPTSVLVTTYYMFTAALAHNHTRFDMPTLATCCKIYVANTGDNTVSVVDGNNDTVKNIIHVGPEPSFILGPPYKNLPRDEIYVANDDSVSVIYIGNDTVKKNINLPISFSLDTYGGHGSPTYMEEIATTGDEHTVEQNAEQNALAYWNTGSGIINSETSYNSDILLLEPSTDPISTAPIDAYHINLSNGTVKQIPFMSDFPYYISSSL